METLENRFSNRSSIGVSVFIEREMRERDVREADREKKQLRGERELKRELKNMQTRAHIHTHTHLDDGIITALRTLTRRTAQTVREILQSLRLYRV